MTEMLVGPYYGIRSPKVYGYKTKVDNAINPDLVVGLELETENCEQSMDFYIDLGARLGIDVKGDGSLREINGNAAYEFITKPTKMENVLVTVPEFLRLSKFKDDNYSDRCSIHVHVNCTDLTFEQVAAVSLIYTVMEETLFKFVNDKPGHKDDWSRDTNIYCVPWNQCRDHLNLVYRFTKTPERALNGWQKYTALNIRPLSTIGTMEWRHMHGTADAVKITKWLNIIGAIYKHAVAVPFDDLVKDIQGLNTESHYGKFFDTVLGGQLTYNDAYRQSMSEGCILAKYSMINWSLEKKNPGSIAKAKPTVRFDPQWMPVDMDAVGAPDERDIADIVAAAGNPAPGAGWPAFQPAPNRAAPQRDTVAGRMPRRVVQDRDRNPLLDPGLARPVGERGNPLAQAIENAAQLDRMRAEQRQRLEADHRRMLEAARRNGQPRF